MGNVALASVHKTPTQCIVEYLPQYIENPRSPKTPEEIKELTKPRQLDVLTHENPFFSKLIPGTFLWQPGKDKDGKQPAPDKFKFKAFGTFTEAGECRVDIERIDDVETAGGLIGRFKQLGGTIKPGELKPGQMANFSLMKTDDGEWKIATSVMTSNKEEIVQHIGSPSVGKKGLSPADKTAPSKTAPSSGAGKTPTAVEKPINSKVVMLILLAVGLFILAPIVALLINR